MTAIHHVIPNHAVLDVAIDGADEVDPALNLVKVRFYSSSDGLCGNQWRHAVLSIASYLRPSVQRDRRVTQSNPMPPTNQPHTPKCHSVPVATQ